MTVSKRTRFEVLKRDGFKCYYCGTVAAEKPLTIDHVVPIALGGSDDLTNLVAACPECNSGKSSVMPESEMVAAINIELEIRKAAQEQLMQHVSDRIEASHEYEDEVMEFWRNYLPSYSLPRFTREATFTSSWFDRGIPLIVVEEAVRIAVDARGVPLSGKWAYAGGVIKNMTGKAEATLPATTRQLDDSFRQGFEQAQGYAKDHDFLTHLIDGTLDNPYTQAVLIRMAMR